MTRHLGHDRDVQRLAMSRIAAIAVVIVMSTGPA
jgi:hypothetical protein